MVNAEHLAVMPRVANAFWMSCTLTSVVSLIISIGSLILKHICSEQHHVVCSQSCMKGIEVSPKCLVMSHQASSLVICFPLRSATSEATQPVHWCQDETVPMQSIKVGLVPATTRSANSWRSNFINFRLIKVPVLWRFASQIDHSSKELCIRDLTFCIFFPAPLDGFWIALKDYGIVGDKRLVKSEVRRTNLLGIDLSLFLCIWSCIFTCNTN